MAKKRTEKEIDEITGTIKGKLQMPLFSLGKLSKGGDPDRDKMVKASLKNINEIISLLDRL